MRSMSISIVVVSTAVGLLQLWSLRRPTIVNKHVHVDGDYDVRYKDVVDAFRRNLEYDWEREGAALTVYHKGEKVVDVWGGYADKSARRLWKQDTLSIAFSCSKAIGALVVAKLVEDGHVSYDDRLTNFWPEFGHKGKANVTVRWLLGHKAGLAYTSQEITAEMAEHKQTMDKLFEQQEPNWIPGSENGYHAVTYGWLVDAVVRRVDPKRRTVGVYFKEEIADKFNVDFHLGLPVCEEHRVARIARPSFADVMSDYWYSPRDFNLFRFFHDKLTGGIFTKVQKTNPFLEFVDAFTLNNPDLHRLEQTAVLGIGNARSMARIFELLRTNKIVGEETVKQMTSNYTTWPDVVTGALVARGQGLMRNQLTFKGKTVNIFGHAGYGGQNLRVDFENELTFAYLSNGLKLGFGDSARTYKKIVEALYNLVL